MAANNESQPGPDSQGREEGEQGEKTGALNQEKEGGGEEQLRFTEPLQKESPKQNSVWRLGGNKVIRENY